jgi:hypothetical protein
VSFWCHFASSEGVPAGRERKGQGERPKDATLAHAQASAHHPPAGKLTFSLVSFLSSLTMLFWFASCAFFASFAGRPGVLRTLTWARRWASARLIPRSADAGAALPVACAGAVGSVSACSGERRGGGRRGAVSKLLASASRGAHCHVLGPTHARARDDATRDPRGLSPIAPLPSTIWNQPL